MRGVAARLALLHEHQRRAHPPHGHADEGHYREKPFYLQIFRLLPRFRVARCASTSRRRTRWRSLRRACAASLAAACRPVRELNHRKITLG